MSTHKARKAAANKKFSHAKLLTTSALTAIGLIAAGVSPANADNWVDLDTTSGSTTTDLSQANTTNIKLNSGRAVMEGDLDINRGWSVNVGRGDLVAIDRENDPTYIYGSLNCAGSCHVMDKNGIIVGATGSVDARSVSLSDGELMNRGEFMAGGSLVISNFSGAGIVNEGTISVAQSGMAALLSPAVSNAGVINAKLGKVTLASAETVTIDPYGDGLFEIALAGEAAKAVIENSGEINAEGGTVQMTALAVKDAVDNVINVDGVVTVASAEVKGGKIVLRGGDVNVSGKLDASGTKGGDVDIDGRDVTLTADSEINADTTIDGGEAGNIKIWGDRLYAYGAISILGRNGFAETSNRLGGAIDSRVLIGENGEWLIDPTDSCIADAAASCAPGATWISTAGQEFAVNNAIVNGFAGISTLSAGSNIFVVDNLDFAATNSGVTYRLQSHEDITVDGAISATGANGVNISLIGDIDSTGTGAITINDNITTNGGNMLASTSGAITWNGDVTTEGGDITGTTDGQNTVHGTLSSDSGTVALSGSGANFWDTGVQIAFDGRVETTSGDISLTADNTKLVINGQAVSDTGNMDVLALNDGRIEFWGAGTLEANAINLEAGLNVSQGASGTIVANALTGSVGRETTLEGTNNDIGTIGDFETGTAAGQIGGFTLNNGSAQTLEIAGTVSTDGGAVEITNNARLDINGGGAINTNDGNATLNANNNSFMHLYGAIDTGAGDTNLNAGSKIVMHNGSTIETNTLTTTAKNVDQKTGSTITANLLEGTLNKAAKFLGTNNDIGTIGNFATGTQTGQLGGFTLADINGFDVSGEISTSGGDISLLSDSAVKANKITILSTGKVLSEGGNIVIDSNGAIDGALGGSLTINGVVDASGTSGTGNVDLNGNLITLGGSSDVTANELDFKGGAVLQQPSSQLQAEMLTGALDLYAEFDGNNNDVAEIGDFATGLRASNPGGFVLLNNSGENLDITGEISTNGGDVEIANNENLNVKASGAIITNGGAFDVTSSTLIDVDNGATINLTDGTAHFDAPQVNLGDDIGTTGVITGTATTVNVENDDAEIQDGVDVASSTAGADITVGEGTYVESVIIDKNDINLKGANVGVDPNNDTRSAETTVQGTEWYTMYVAGDGVTIDGFRLVGNNDAGNDDYGIITDHAAGVTVQNNILEQYSFGVFYWDGSTNIATSGGLIQDNRIFDIDGQAIHVRGSQYADILNNTIYDTQVGITTEFMAQPNPGAGTPLVDGNTISAKSIGIRSNLVTGNGTGYQISNNDITAEDPLSSRRWAGIEIISHPGTVATTFLNNTIDAAALIGSGRLTSGYEVTNVLSPNVVIDGGSVNNVDYGVWAADGNFFTGPVNDLLIQNVAFSDIGEAAILVEDVIDVDNVGNSVNTTGTSVTIGAGNTYTNTPYELALAGSDVTVNFTGGVTGANTVLVKAGGAATFEGPNVNGDTLERENAPIQKGVEYAAAGGQVDIEAGTFTEGDINVDKNLLINGAGKNQTLIDASGFTNGFVFNTDLGNTNTTIRRLSVDNASNAGVLVADSATLKVLTLNQTAFNNNGNNGVAVRGNSAKDVRILNSDFLDNGLGGSINGGGDGDILIYKYNGDLTVRNVTIENNDTANAADYGIQIRGSDTPAASGAIILDDVQVSGDYRAALIGIQRYDGVDLTMTDVALGGQTTALTDSAGWGSLYLSELGGDNVDIGNTSFDVINGQHILLGSEPGSPDVDARDAIFEGVVGNTATTAQSFDIENKVFHDMDLAGLGHVTWKDGEVFVTTSTLGIQNGIDVAGANDIVNIADGTYTENLLIDKSIKLKGQSLNTILEYDTANDGPGRGTAGNLITITAEDVNIDPMLFDGLGVADHGLVATNADNLIVDGNTFQGFLLTNINVSDSADVQIFGNDITGAEKGIYGNNVTNAQIFDNEVNATTTEGIHIADSAGTSNADNVDLWNNTIASATGTGILIEDSAFVSVGPHPSNLDATSSYADGNEVTGGDAGIVVTDSDNAYIVYNTVNSINGDAIVVSGSADTNILTNKIGTAGGPDNVVGDGIHVTGSDSAIIKGNKVERTHSVVAGKGSGIRVHNSDDVVIGGAGADGNTVNNTGLDGIRVTGSDNATIDDNDVTKSERHGIFARNLTNSTITNNTIDEVTNRHGIAIRGGDTIEVSGNIIDDTQRHGIFANGVANLTIDGNFIGQNAGDIGRDGINVEGSEGAVISNNEITDAARDGINVGSSDSAEIKGNTIYGQATASVFSPSSTSIMGAGRDGIHVEDSQSVVIDDNTVQGDAAVLRKDGLGAGRHGIFVSGGDTPFSGNGVRITNNNILGELGLLASSDSVGGDGIHVENNANANIRRNTVNLTGENGITVEDSFDADVINNTVTGTGENGLKVSGSFGADIRRNTVSLTDDDGIDVEGSAFVDVVNNTVSLTGDDGIDVENSFDADIINNTVTLTDDDGIEVSGSFGADIRRNTVSLSGDDGIDVEGSAFVDVVNNEVTGSGDDGIDVEGSFAADVINNTVTGSNDDGIEVSDSFGANIRRNTVTVSGDDGIDVKRSAFVDIINNIVGLADDNGIEVGRSFDADIRRNTVGLNGGDSIRVNRSAFADIRNNFVVLSGDNGIDVRNSFGVDIVNNTVFGTLSDGIRLRNSDSFRVNRNTVGFSFDGGIDVRNSDDGTINRNTVGLVAGNGIDLRNADNVIINNNDVTLVGGAGIFVDPSSNITVTNNTIDLANIGIYFLDVTDSSIDTNTITNSVTTGVQLENVDGVELLTNSITGSGAYGLHVMGPNNGSVILAGNEFIDNPTGALFESGAIDLRGPANSFINTVPGFTPIGMQFELANPADPTSPSLVGNTIGSTSFSGFGASGSFFVRFEDGALATPAGVPIIINGLNASFNGFVPASQSGILTQAQLDFLEDRIFDADDTGLFGRGQLFVGALQGIENFEDFLQGRGFGQFGATGLSLTVTGLPPINLPNNLANIEPAAGGDGTDGFDPEDLANIEPAAGGEETSCWAAAGTGGNVTVSFDGGFGDAALDAAASCGTGI